MAKEPAREPPPPAVDLEVLRQATEGDRDLMQELAELYIGDADLKIRALDDALSNNDMHRIRTIGHSLKGASASIGAAAAAEVFGRLERAAKEADVPAIKQAISEGEACFEQVRKALADLR